MIFCYFVKILFIYSSSVHSYLIFLLIAEDFFWGLIYTGVYLLIIFFFVNSFLLKDRKEKIFSFFLFFVLIRLPPLPVFFLKWVLIFRISLVLGGLLIFLVFFILLAVFSYFRVAAIIFNKFTFLAYQKQKFFIFKLIFFLSCFFYFFLFSFKLIFKLLIFKINNKCFSYNVKKHISFPKKKF